MKKLLVFCSLWVLTPTFGRIVTLCNDTSVPAQYRTVSDALAAVNPGDTIYVMGSATTYSFTSFAKRIVLLGSGHSPIKNQNRVPTVEIVFVSSLTSGTVISGVRISRLSVYAHNVNNITVHRSFIQSSVHHYGYRVDGWIFEGNYLNSDISFSNNLSGNVLISNNVFNGSSRVMYGGADTRCIIVNNIFLGTDANSDVFFDMNNMVVANNIFFRRMVRFNNPTSGNTFLNNIVFSNNTQTGVLFANLSVGGANVLQNNFLGIAPKFVNLPATLSGDYFANHTSPNLTVSPYRFDFFLAPDSPVGLLAGTDGKDIGLVRDSFSPDGHPAIPEITSFVILNPVLPYNSTLTPVQFQVKAKNRR